MSFDKSIVEYLNDTSKLDLLVNDIKNALPHGSGINSSWDIEHEGNLVFNCSNSFHAMDQNGYYCGYVDFDVTINLLSSSSSTLISNLNVDKEMIEDILKEYDDDEKFCGPYLDDLEDCLFDKIDSCLLDYRG